MKCKIEEIDAGRAYPRTCPMCGIGGSCKKRLDRAGLKQTVAELEDNINLKADFIDKTMNDAAVDYETISVLRSKLEEAVEIGSVKCPFRDYTPQYYVWWAARRSQLKQLLR